MDDDDFTPYDLPPEKRRRALRVDLKRKHRRRDRYKPKSWMLWAWTRIVHWKHDHSERDYEFGRTKAPTDTGDVSLYGASFRMRPVVSQSASSGDTYGNRRVVECHIARIQPPRFHF